MVEISYTQVAIYGIIVFTIADFILHLVWHIPGFIKRRRERSKANTLEDKTVFLEKKSTSFSKPQIVPPEVSRFKPAYPEYSKLRQKLKEQPKPQIKLETYN